MSSSTKEEFGLTFLLEKLNNAVLNIIEMEKKQRHFGAVCVQFSNFFFKQNLCITYLTQNNGKKIIVVNL